jgi:hypothetical protein
MVLPANWILCVCVFVYSLLQVWPPDAWPIFTSLIPVMANFRGLFYGAFYNVVSSNLDPRFMLVPFCFLFFLNKLTTGVYDMVYSFVYLGHLTNQRQVNFTGHFVLVVRIKFNLMKMNCIQTIHFAT